MTDASNHGTEMSCEQARAALASAESDSAVDAHVNGCADCASFAEDVAHLVARSQALPKPRMPQMPSAPRQGWRWASAGIALALAVAVGAVLWDRGPGSEAMPADANAKAKVESKPAPAEEGGDLFAFLEQVERDVADPGPDELGGIAAVLEIDVEPDPFDRWSLADLEDDDAAVELLLGSPWQRGEEDEDS